MNTLNTMNMLLACVVLVAAVAAAPGQHAPVQQHAGVTGVDSDLLREELRAWSEAGQPDFIQFHDDNRKPVWAAVLGRQPGAPGTEAALMGILPDADDIKFHLFTGAENAADIEGKEVDSSKSLLDAGFDKSLPTKVIIHGFSNTISSSVIQEIKNAYLASGRCNVIGVDWGWLCPAPLYVTARLNVPVAGKRVGELLQTMIEDGLTTPDLLHLIGHSLGAHVAGLAGKSLIHASGKRVSRITGLDPAWPLFIITPESDRLYKDDAAVVDVIHTCAGLLGFADALGTSDFYPNGGREQPGCGADVVGVCAHSRSYEYFAETITDGKGFQAVYCNSDEDALSGKCTMQRDGCMGDEVHFKEAGSYFLRTDNADPQRRCK